jgi:oligosaccharide repeat unit polymerase
MLRLNNILIMFACLLCFSFLMVTEPSVQSALDPGKKIIWMCIGIVLPLVYLALVHRSGWVSITVLFITGFIIVHFQWALMLTYIDYAEILLVDYSKYEVYFPYALWLSSLASVCLVLGLTLVTMDYSKPHREFSNFELSSYANYIILSLLFIFVVAAGPSYFDGTDFSAGGMDAISGLAGYAHKLLKPLIILAMLSILCKASRYGGLTLRNLVFLSPFTSILIALYCFIFMVSGDRGEVLQPVLVGLLAYNYFFKKVTLTQYICLVLVGSLCLSFMGYWRAGIYDDFAINSFADLTLNLAQSNRVLLIAISDASVSGFHYGMLWLSSLISSVPGAQSLLISMTDLTRFDINSSAYLTFTVLGENPHTGLGSTIVADVYLNFGVYGVCFMFTTLGLLIKKMERSFLHESNIAMLAAIIYGSMAIFIVRDTFFGVVQIIIWTIIAFVILRKRNIGILPA